MRRMGSVTLALMLALGACGGGDGGASGDDSGDGGGGGGGSVVDKQPSGQAHVTVDGREYTLTDPGALECSIGEDELTFSFIIGDNEVVLGGGVTMSNDGWFGSIDLRIANPDGEPGPISYFPDFRDLPDGVAVEGDSVSYSGPLMKQTPMESGNLPDPVDVGNGVISATCP